MARPGDAEGEYRGLMHRNDAELKAWMEQRLIEAALEPGLPIIDPHHHFWDAPHRGRYFLPELLADIGRRAQHRRHRLPRMPGDVPQARPA